MDRWIARPGQAQWSGAWISEAVYGSLPAFAIAVCLILWLRLQVKRKTDALRASNRRLQDREQRYRRVMESAMDGLWIVDQHGRLAEVNQAYADMSGYRTEELVGVPLEQLLADGEREKVPHRLREVTERGSHMFESRHRRKDGSIMEVEISASYDPHETQMITAFIRDITERKLIEARLEEYCNFVEHSSEIMALLDRDHVYRMVNQAFLQQRNLSRDQVLGKSVEEVLGPQGYREVRAYLDRCLQGEDLRFEVSFEYPDSGLRRLEINYHPFAGPDGTMERVAAIVRDVTERKRAEEALEQKMREMETFIDNIPHMAWLKDARSTFVLVNRAFGNAVGMDPGRIQHSDGSACFSDRLLRAIKRSDWKAVSTRQPLTLEETFVDASGRKRFLQTSKSPIFDDQGRITGTAGISVDITERKEAEHELRDSHEKLEHRVRRRTSELTEVNAVLKEEIAERKRAENREQRRNSILTALASGEPLDSILENITRSIESEDPRSICSILLVDESGRHLLHGSAPNLPDFYNQAIHNLRIGPDVGSCGTAAYTGRLVTAADVLTHSAWKDFRELAQRAGLRACWSQPVFSSEGRVIATFAVYHREPRTPGVRDIERIQTAADLASLAIERKRAEEELRKSRDELELRVRRRTEELTRLNEQLKAEIAERKEAEKKLNYLSFRDSLTGLYNRNFFEEEMQRLQDGRGASIGIVVCDLNGLKFINDTLGHESGDRLLAATAEVLRRTFRSGDIVARIGGDEFAVLVPNAGRELVETLVGRLRSRVDTYNMETKTHISLSIGHAAGNGGSIDMHALFREADNRMYREKMQRERSSRSHIVQALMKAMEARDFVTEGHSDRLQQLVLPLARSRGLPEDAINDLLLFSRFHDLGKVGIPDSILGKPGALTEEEAEEMRKHSEIGHRIAKSVPDLAPIADLILKHHEWWNGRGYPLGLAGEDIPLPCRILAIADAFDAMTSDRPYRRAMSREKAVEELRASAGSQFDPELVEQFVATLDCRTAHRVTSTKQTG